ncbi:kinase-like domain-containing protein [Fusarium flagelliforme]|uniref:kinase-like domain-containing protein n=1 Tax=Fusarium flagelliforme TaxID=2675880 RepID=UPI001E8D7143|nr:kinase-like domain-containing protein [Fusarium flagelliforme]KAH7174220.1 kinase-like domain-containing protein [Fusarium flagelliforme]
MEPEGRLSNMDRASNSDLEAPAAIGGDGTDTQDNDPSDTRTIRQKVRERICEAIRPTPEFYNKPEAFVLECDLRNILSRETVQLLLDRIHCRYPHKPKVNLNAIFDDTNRTERLKILATLIYIEKTKSLHDFITSNVWDNHLPLSTSSGVFSNWKGAWSKEFVGGQYMFLPQKIDFECMEHKEFHESTRMPFLNPLVDPREGAHGVVTKVRIHHEYQEWGDRTRCKDHYAVKRFTADATTFQQEREALIRFSHPNAGHRSLIQLLYSYELASKKYLIFPCAEGDLEYHWAQHEADPTSHADLIWMVQECHGIASGLSKVHDHTSWKPGAGKSGSRNKGRHGDIKPKNILFFRDEETSPGRLVVADFTLMRFHSSIDADYTRIRNVGYSRTYRPPEMDAGGGTKVSQKYDIWTLGCVFLEFITWHLLGSDAIRPRKEGLGRGFVAPDGYLREDFCTSRQRDDNTGCRYDKFFNSYYDLPPVVKPSVMKWIDYLRGHECCSEALNRFLDLIERHMLIARPEDRCSMLQVTTTMADILSTAQSSPAYCQPLQRPNPAGAQEFPHLLASSDPYWPSVVLPQPQTSEAAAPQNSDLDLLENVILSPGPLPGNTEGGLGIPRGKSSLEEASNSFRTGGSSEIPRESVDYHGSFTVTPATTRQPSVQDKPSEDTRPVGLTEREERGGHLRDIRISKVSFEKVGGKDDVTVNYGKGGQQDLLGGGKPGYFAYVQFSPRTVSK